MLFWSEAEPVLTYGVVELPASFAVWIVSSEAEILKGKFVWSNWDVEELKAKKEQFKSSQDLTLGVLGWPERCDCVLPMISYTYLMHLHRRVLRFVCYLTGILFKLYATIMMSIKTPP